MPPSTCSVAGVRPTRSWLPSNVRPLAYSRPRESSAIGSLTKAGDALLRHLDAERAGLEQDTPLVVRSDDPLSCAKVPLALNVCDDWVVKAADCPGWACSSRHRPAQVGGFRESGTSWRRAPSRRLFVKLLGSWRFPTSAPPVGVEGLTVWSKAGCYCSFPRLPCAASRPDITVSNPLTCSSSPDTDSLHVSAPDTPTKY